MLAKKLKKQLSTNQPPKPIFFIDRDLGQHKFPKALIDAGHRVEVHDEHFAQDTPDHVWLSEVGKKGWIVVTRNTSISSTKLELDTLMESKVKAFFLVSRPDTPHQELIERFLSLSGRIYNLLDAHRIPFIAKIYGGQNPSAKIFLTKRQWERQKKK